MSSIKCILHAMYYDLIIGVGINKIANKGTYILWRRNINYVNRTIRENPLCYKEIEHKSLPLA